MKPFILLSVLLIAAAVEGQSNERRRASDEEDGGRTKHKDNSVSGGVDKWRSMQTQIDRLETRVDKMIQLWNEFVDNNRDGPYHPGGPGRDHGGRPPYDSGNDRYPHYPRRPEPGRRREYQDGARSPSSMYGNRRRGPYMDDDDDYPPPPVSSHSRQRNF